MREDQALRPDVPEPRNAAADRACVKITRGLIEEYINGLRRKQHPFDSRKTYRRALQLFCDSLPESMESMGARCSGGGRSFWRRATRPAPST